MKTRSFVVLGFVGVAALATACSVSSEQPSTVEPTPAGVDTQGKTPSQAEMLNFSHAECNADGTVNVHFVLLFHGSSPPAELVADTNWGEYTADSYKSSGNVWHYNITVPAGELIVLSSTHVGSTYIHNPGDEGDFSYCGHETSQCSVEVTPGAVCMHANDIFGASGKQGIPDEQRECEWLGLTLIKKDDGSLFNGSNTGLASISAYVAIVKGGNGGGDVCEAGSGSIYNIYSPVTAGQTLWTGNKTGISHVTYCDCPSQ